MIQRAVTQHRSIEQVVSTGGPDLSVSAGGPRLKGTVVARRAFLFLFSFFLFGGVLCGRWPTRLVRGHRSIDFTSKDIPFLDTNLACDSRWAISNRDGDAVHLRFQHCFSACEKGSSETKTNVQECCSVAGISVHGDIVGGFSKSAQRMQSPYAWRQVAACYHYNFQLSTDAANRRCTNRPGNIRHFQVFPWTDGYDGVGLFLTVAYSLFEQALVQ